jgi:hypothetical protein
MLYPITSASRCYIYCINSRLYLQYNNTILLTLKYNNTILLTLKYNNTILLTLKYNNTILLTLQYNNTILLTLKYNNTILLTLKKVTTCCTAAVLLGNYVDYLETYLNPKPSLLVTKPICHDYLETFCQRHSPI